MSARELIADAAARLGRSGVASPRLDARILLGHVLGMPASEAAASDRGLGPRELDCFKGFIDRRARNEPVAYITGKKEFWSLELDVGPGVLVPRPETETLIEEFLRAFPDREAPLEILDLGTGSGCLLVAALHEFPNASGTGIDRSETALGWARRNVAKHGLAERCRLIGADWERAKPGSYDAILANPPYISSAEIAALVPDVARYEPIGALDGGADGLDAYRRIAGRIAELLKPEGTLFAEIGEGQSEQVSTIFAEAGAAPARIAPDLAGIPRCVVCRRRNR